MKSDGLLVEIFTSKGITRNYKKDTYDTDSYKTKVAILQKRFYQDMLGSNPIFLTQEKIPACYPCFRWNVFPSCGNLFSKVSETSSPKAIYRNALFSISGTGSNKKNSKPDFSDDFIPIEK